MISAYRSRTLGQASVRRLKATKRMKRRQRKTTIRVSVNHLVQVRWAKRNKLINTKYLDY